MSSSRLFKPIQLGPYSLKNRVALAPLTRFRANDDHVPLPMVADYYEQRGSTPGTLLITEATAISPGAAGYANIPGLWTHEQLDSWKNVTDAVHKKDSYIFAQLWHLGRAGDASVLAKKGKDVVSASAIAIDDKHATPRALKEAEIHAIIREYAQAARNAVFHGGFDGIEIHGANGYLPDQFMQDVSNKREDQWGGSIENRARFVLELTRAIAKEIGPERIGIRLSPWGAFQSMLMAHDDVLPQFLYVVRELKKIGITYIHLIEPRASNGFAAPDLEKLKVQSNQPFIDEWRGQGPVILAGGFDDKNFSTTLDEHHKDDEIMAAYGRYFISTPDLVYRLQKGIALNPYDRDSFYLPMNAKGYTDYAFSDEFLAENKEFTTTTSEVQP